MTAIRYNFAKRILALILIFLSLMMLVKAELSYAAMTSTAQLPFFTLKKTITNKLQQPTAVAIDTHGQAFILNANNSVQVYSATGAWLYAFPTHITEQLNGAMDIKFFQDKIYIADSKNHRILVLSKQGKVLRTITTATNNQTAREPVSLAIDKHTISFSDRKNHQICQIKHSEQVQVNDNSSTILCFAKRGKKSAEFNFPFQIIKDNRGYQYIVDVLNARVQKFNRFGKNPLVISQFGLEQGELFRPNGIALDSQQRLYVSDAYLGDISVFKDGKFLGLAQGIKTLNSPNSLLWHNKHLWIVDYRDNAVYQYQLMPTSSQTNKSTHFTSRKNTVTLKQRLGFSQKECISCHISWQADIAASLSKIVARQILPVASQKMCDSCHHGAVIDSRRAITGYQHPSLLDEKQNSPSQSAKIDINNRTDDIDPRFPLTETKQLSCASCHTPHSDNQASYSLYQEHNNNWLRIANNKQEICQTCHQGMTKGADARIPPANSSHVSLKSQGVNHPIKVLLDKLPIKRHKDSKNQPNALVPTGITLLQQGLPKSLLYHGASLDAQRQLECQSCHQIHGGFSEKLLTENAEQQKFCTSCHEKQAASSVANAREKGIHPVNFKLEQTIEFNGEHISTIGCQTCHSPHNGSSNTALLANAVKNAEAQCLQCHQDYNADSLTDARKHNIHPVNIALLPRENNNADKSKVLINDKEITEIGCLTCHSVHQGEKNTAALVAPISNGELCQHCHKNQALVINSDHDLRVTAPSSHNALKQQPHQAGVCGSCHSMHQGKQGDIALSAEAKPDKPRYIQEQQLAIDMPCLNCHQEQMAAKKKALARFSHPKEDMILRSTDRQMPLFDKNSKTSEFGEIACKTCHNVHSWQPTKFTALAQQSLIFNPKTKNIEGDSHNSFLRNLGVKNSFCVDCHRDETLFKYRYYHDKRSEQEHINYLK